MSGLTSNIPASRMPTGAGLQTVPLNAQGAPIVSPMIAPPPGPTRGGGLGGIFNDPMKMAVLGAIGRGMAEGRRPVSIGHGYYARPGSGVGAGLSGGLQEIIRQMEKKKEEEEELEKELEREERRNKEWERREELRREHELEDAASRRKHELEDAASRREHELLKLAEQRAIRQIPSISLMGRAAAADVDPMKPIPLVGPKDALDLMYEVVAKEAQLQSADEEAKKKDKDLADKIKAEQKAKDDALSIRLEGFRLGRIPASEAVTPAELNAVRHWEVYGSNQGGKPKPREVSEIYFRQVEREVIRQLNAGKSPDDFGYIDGPTLPPHVAKSLRHTMNEYPVGTTIEQHVANFLGDHRFVPNPSKGRGGNKAGGVKPSDFNKRVFGP